MSATPGPWRWVISLCNKRVALYGGVPRFDLTVMDFTRWGMSGAAPRFREDVDRMNIMHRCDENTAKVPGREHHEDWFRDLDHPDARLIAAAPELLDALRELLAEYQHITPRDSSDPVAKGRAAIAKAEGK